MEEQIEMIKPKKMVKAAKKETVRLKSFWMFWLAIGVAVVFIVIACVFENSNAGWLSILTNCFFAFGTSLLASAVLYVLANIRTAEERQNAKEYILLKDLTKNVQFLQTLLFDHTNEQKKYVSDLLDEIESVRNILPDDLFPLDDWKYDPLDRDNLKQLRDIVDGESDVRSRGEVLLDLDKILSTLEKRLAKCEPVKNHFDNSWV